MNRGAAAFTPGEVINGLTVNSYVAKSMWLMTCVCGAEFKGSPRDVQRGLRKSCGCKRRELSSLHNTIHGHYKGGRPDRIASVWHSMRHRCYNPNYAAYSAYGARGVTVCDSWRDSIEAFAADMGPRPPGTTLDRIDVTGNYEPSNCRWATHAQQARNKRGALRTPDGECLKDFAEREGLSYQRLRAYHFRRGIPFAEAVQKSRTPRKNYKRRQDWG